MGILSEHERATLLPASGGPAGAPRGAQNAVAAAKAAHAKAVHLAATAAVCITWMAISSALILLNKDLMSSG
jgi:hypothetical protein